MDNSPQPSPDEDNPNTRQTNPIQEPDPVAKAVNEDMQANETVDDDAPILARIVDDTPDRVGSPFAAAPSGKKTPQQPVVALHDSGPLQYTAMGGVVAATMLLVFAIFALAWVARSKFKRTTTGMLVTHACLFVACFISANT
jgi:hypothetical protein